MLVLVSLVIMIALYVIVTWPHVEKCDDCKCKLEEIGNDYDKIMSCICGYDTFYKCPKCGRKYKIHHYTYD